MTSALGFDFGIPSPVYAPWTSQAIPTGPQIGDFGLITYKSGSLIDEIAERLISFGTNSPFVHAFVYAGNNQIVEAARHVQVSPVTSYTNITWSTGRLPANLIPTDLQRQAIVQAALSYVGQSYNLLDILAIALAQVRLGRIVDGDEWWAKRLSDDHMAICSQLVVNAYRAAGVDLFPGKLSGLVSPGDLGNLLTGASL